MVIKSIIIIIIIVDRGLLLTANDIETRKDQGLGKKRTRKQPSVGPIPTHGVDNTNIYFRTINFDS